MLQTNAGKVMNAKESSGGNVNLCTADLPDSAKTAEPYISNVVTAEQLASRTAMTSTNATLVAPTGYVPWEASKNSRLDEGSAHSAYVFLLNSVAPLR